MRVTPRRLAILQVILISTLILLLLVEQARAQAPEPSASVTEETCGSVDLLFSNPTDVTVQFELRIDGGATTGGGVFTLVTGTTEPWTLTFEEDSGVHIVDYRILPDGQFETLADVESDCLPNNGSITIVKEADGAGDLEFDFDISGTDFDLEDDESVTFSLPAGDYLISESVTSGWVLTDIDCTSDSSDADVNDYDVAIDLDPDDEITCLFTNEAVPTPTPTNTSTPVPTATRTPAPTSTPVSVVVTRTVEVPVTVVVPRTITPPSTGTGGLVNRWGGSDHSQCWTVWYWNTWQHKYVPVFYCW